MYDHICVTKTTQTSDHARMTTPRMVQWATCLLSTSSQWLMVAWYGAATWQQLASGGAPVNHQHTNIGNKNSLLQDFTKSVRRETTTHVHNI